MIKYDLAVSKDVCNLTMCKCFFEAINILENTLAYNLDNTLNSDAGYVAYINSLKPKQVNNPNVIDNSTHQNNKGFMTFGNWTYLFKGHRSLFNNVNLKQIFPYSKKPITVNHLGSICSDLDTIREYRNIVYHNHYLLDNMYLTPNTKIDLKIVFKSIMKYINYMIPNISHEIITLDSEFDRVYNQAKANKWLW